jgi:type II secretory pathway component PulM
VLKYGSLLVLGVVMFWMWRRATPRSRRVVGGLFLVLLAIAFYVFVYEPLVHPGG